MDMQELVARRSKAAARQDEARDAFANHDRRFGDIVLAVARELDAIAKQMVTLSDSPVAEIGRTYMWLGDAWFDLAQGRHCPFEPSIQAYREASPFVRAARDPLLQAKLDANLANILVRANPSAPTLAEGVTLYEAALPVLAQRAPEHVPFVEEQLGKARELLGQFRTLAGQIEAATADAKRLLRTLPTYTLRTSDAAGIAQGLDNLAKLRVSGSIADLMSALQTAKDLLTRLMDLADHTQPDAGRADRPKRVSGLAMRLWQELASETLDAFVDKATRDRANELTTSLVDVVNRITAQPAETSAIEHAQLRDLAMDARRLLARAHLTWLEPSWQVGNAPVDSSGVYLTDSPTRPLLERLCRSRQLALLEVSQGQEVAEATFNAVRCAAVVVADISGADPLRRAAACYEVGIALALGKPLVVLGAPGGVPFDVDIEPVPAGSSAPDEATLGDAIDSALLLPQRAGSAGDLGSLVVAAKAAFAGQPVLLDELERRREEPSAAAAVLESMLRAAAAKSPRSRMVAYPAWRRPTREPDTRRLFHVMPFGADWSDQLKRTARAICGSAVTYRRHDDVTDPHIIRSLWDELCLATHILVDLTDFNANVLVELGIADALGTPTLLVGQPGTVARMFPMLRRVRLTEYGMGDRSFQTALERFLAS